MSNPLADMDKPDVIFCIGTNMTEAHPVAAMGLKKALAKGAKMIVADPRRIGLANLSHLYLPIRQHTQRRSERATARAQQLNFIHNKSGRI